MKTISYLIAGLAMAFAPATVSGQEADGLTFEHHGDTLTVVHIGKQAKYLILPVEELSGEAKVNADPLKGDEVPMDVRLAVNATDYYVPFPLPAGTKTVTVRRAPASAQCWAKMSLSDTFDTSNTDYYRPLYHHTPLYGWMNDPNGMVYKDGEYHLYFQYNPYGSKWGNMHWGHSVSRDLIHWRHLDPAIARDTLGHIFSGSTVVDKAGTAGYGKDALIALYTSASDERGQIQSMAYSTDNGRTYKKYDKNPVLTPFDGLKDFRDPKVFWYAPDKKWIMIVSADKEMRFYSSHDLKQWTYMSAFGKGYGAQPNQFECPDFVQMPVNGDKDNMKWVMLVNINPGCMFGGSATEYFVGDFDGEKFTCDTKPGVVKWLDYGKDHYAAVCISNTGDRTISIPWMSNWQYANITPIRQYRGANGLPRELSLYTKDGQAYVAANVVKEAACLRQDSTLIGDLAVSGRRDFTPICKDNGGAYELVMDVTPGQAATSGFELSNAKGEKVKIYIDAANNRLVMDRTESGITDLTKWGNYDVHAKETDDHRKHLSVNYKNDFALGTWAPLTLCEGKTYHLDVFVDKCSVEIFVDGGRIAMTNLVFPTAPYDTLTLYSDGGEMQVKGLKTYKLGL